MTEKTRAWKTLLVDHNPDLAEVWDEVFQDFDEVEVRCDDIFALPSDAIVSPANSFGIMDGGIDLILRNKLGFDVQHRLQSEIKEQFHGELPVGSAIIVPTKKEPWRFLIAAPTMRIPQRVGQTLNPYLAFRAVLLAVKRFNERASEDERIKSLTCPGLGTGIGGVSPRVCAGQMRIAYNYLSKPARIPSFDEIHQMHRTLKSIL